MGHLFFEFVQRASTAIIMGWRRLGSVYTVHYVKYLLVSKV